jgi:CheY-like chemotaxis protein
MASGAGPSHVLIIEPDRDLGSTLAGVVEDLAAGEVVIAESAARAAEILRAARIRPNAALVNVGPNDASAAAVIDAIGIEPELRDVPLVTMTAGRAATPSPAAAHVSLPCDVEDLERALATANPS